MEHLQKALKDLENAVIHLETAVHSSAKEKENQLQEISQLKEAVKTTYQRLDKALLSYQEGES